MRSCSYLAGRLANGHGNSVANDLVKGLRLRPTAVIINTQTTAMRQASNAYSTELALLLMR